MPGAYDPRVFAVRDLEEAKRIILTHEDSSTSERWAKETPYLADLIEEHLAVSPATLLLDYGTGIGRLAKEVIERQDCMVLGVDISPSMRTLAPMYVRSDRYAVCSPEMLVALVGSGLRFDAAISVWVLQHCAEPQRDLSLIAASLHPQAPFLVVNNEGRAVPTDEGWIDDGLSIRSALLDGFELQAEGKLSEEATSPAVARHTFWACLRRSADD